jgi:hypothetical protein
MALRVIKLNMVQNKRQVLTKCSKGPEKFLKDPRSNKYGLECVVGHRTRYNCVEDELSTNLTAQSQG